MKAAGQRCSVRAMTLFRLLLVLGSLCLGLGCKPKIGEDCTTSVDCSISGDRLCDVTQPSGYCTVFNCEPNGCPDEAACIAFGEGTCSNPSVSVRYRRTFCMRSCEDDSDCRGGSYRCLDVSQDPYRQLVDTNPSSRRICAVPTITPSTPPHSDPAVCFPSDASFDVSRPEAGRSPDAPVEADAIEASTVDRANDRRDAIDNDAADEEAGPEGGTGDALDSSLGETGDSATSDTLDDAAEETEAVSRP